MPKPKRRKARRRTSTAPPAPFGPGSDIARDLQSLLRSAEARLGCSELPRVLVDVLDDIIAQRDHGSRPRGAIVDHDARRGYRHNPFGEPPRCQEALP